MPGVITVTDGEGKPIKCIEGGSRVYVLGKIGVDWVEERFLSVNAGAVCAHSSIRFEDGKAICESCGEALKLVPAQPPHAPATPPPKG